MVFKKDITPLGRGSRTVVHKGKGATEQRTGSREQESLTSASPMDRMTNRYPAAPQPPPDAPRPMPPGGSIGPSATAAMPTPAAPPRPIVE